MNSERNKKLKKKTKINKIVYLFKIPKTFVKIGFFSLMEIKNYLIGEEKVRKLRRIVEGIRC